MKQELAHHLLGASEIAAALAVHPFKSRMALWLEKTGQVPAFNGNDRTVWGLDVEVALRAWYAREFEVAIWVPPASLISAEHPFLRSTPDGLALVDSECQPDDPSNWSSGFEAKNTDHRQAHRWGEPGTDEVPSEHLWQAQQNMLVTGLARWHVVASIGGAPPAVYEVARDEEMIGAIVDGGAEFMRLVRDRVPPAIDGSDDWASYIRERYPWSSDDYIQARAEDDLLACEWREVALQLSDLEKREAELKNRLAVVIGSASGIETSVGKITYRPRRGGPDYKSAFEGLAKDAELSDQERGEMLATHQRRSSRPLLRPRAWSNQ